MDALTALESRAGQGRSIFENAHLSSTQRQANFARAIGADGGEGVDVADADDSALLEQDEPETEDAADTGAHKEHPTTSEQDDDASGPDGMAFPSVDPENVERLLGLDIGKKAAKTLTDSVVRPLAQQLNGVAAQTQKVRVERLVSKFGRVYPELKRAEAVNAVVQSAIAQAKKGDTDEVAFTRALTGIYGDRKREMREQTGMQMSAPRRTTTDKPVKYTREQADLAALDHLQKTGDRAGAIALKQKLLNAG